MKNSRLSPIALVLMSVLIGQLNSVEISFWPTILEAQEVDSAEPLDIKIARMNEEIDTQQAELVQVDLRSKELESKLKIVKAELDKLQKEERALVAQLKSINEERADIEKELSELQLDSERIKSVSTERIKALYMHPNQELFAFLIKQADSQSIARNGFYLTVVRQYDLKLLERLKEVKFIRAEKRTELDLLVASKEKVASELKGRQKQLQVKAAEQEPIVNSLKEEKRRREQVLQEMRAKVLRFETVLAGLTGGEEIEAEQENKTKRNKRKLEHSEQAVIVGYDGPGLKGRKGSLVLPVQGKIITGYGKMLSGDSKKLFALSKGLEIGCEPESAIKAIADGEVIFVGKMPGFGPIVILDHGERYYSLYGRLATISVEKGEEVKQGVDLGTSSIVDEMGRNFYFEIRKNGTPINPSDFLNFK